MKNIFTNILISVITIFFSILKHLGKKKIKKNMYEKNWKTKNIHLLKKNEIGLFSVLLFSVWFPLCDIKNK